MAFLDDYDSCASKSKTSITVFPSLCNKTTAFVSWNANLQIAFPALVISRIKSPVSISHNLTCPSLPPETIRFSSNCKHVTELSWAAMCWTQRFVSRSQIRIAPSLPPVTRIDS